MEQIIVYGLPILVLILITLKIKDFCAGIKNHRERTRQIKKWEELKRTLEGAKEIMIDIAKDKNFLRSLESGIQKFEKMESLPKGKEN